MTPSYESTFGSCMPRSSSFFSVFKAYYGMIFTFKLKLSNYFTSGMFGLVNFYLSFITNLRVASCCTLLCGCSCISNCVIIPNLWCCSLIGPHFNCQAVALFSVGCTLLRRKALADYQGRCKPEVNRAGVSTCGTTVRKPLNELCTIWDCLTSWL